MALENLIRLWPIGLVWVVVMAFCVMMATGWQPFKRKRKMEGKAEDKKESRIFYVIVKGKWEDKSVYRDRDQAISFAQGMAKRGYDCDVVKVVARVEAVYAVDTRIHD